MDIDWADALLLVFFSYGLRAQNDFLALNVSHSGEWYKVVPHCVQKWSRTYEWFMRLCA